MSKRRHLLNKTIVLWKKDWGSAGEEAVLVNTAGEGRLECDVTGLANASIAMTSGFWRRISTTNYDQRNIINEDA